VASLFGVMNKRPGEPHLIAGVGWVAWTKGWKRMGQNIGTSGIWRLG